MVLSLKCLQNKLISFAQLFSTSIHVVVFTIALLTTCTLVGLLFTRFYYIPLLYLLWYYYDRDTPYKCGRLCSPLRKMTMWRLLAEYFPVTLHKTVDIDPAGNYIFAAHPHGHFGHGYYCTFVSDAAKFNQLFPGIHRHVLTVDSFFRWPFLREWILAFGGGSISPDSIEYKLTKLGPGHSVYLCVGGTAEMFLANNSDYVVRVLNHKGFIRLALKTGAAVIPVFQFGETRQFEPAELKKGSLASWVIFVLEAIWRVKLPYIRGKLSALVPLGRPINHVVGAPINFEEMKSSYQTEEQMVDACHAVYLKALRELFDRHKSSFGDTDTKLIFV